MADQNLTPEYLREHFLYDPQTGLFSRIKKTADNSMLGPVGRVAKRGAVSFSVLGKKHYAHRLAWLYFYGAAPAQEIDHIDGDPTNNSIANLRAASSAENKQNLRGPKRSNKSGFLGVFNHAPGVWRARIQVNGRCRHLGLFHDPESAHLAYVEAKRLLHPFGTL